MALETIVPLSLCVAGCLLAAIGYANRRSRRLRPYLGVIYLIALGQVIWGAVFWVMLNA